MLHTVGEPLMYKDIDNLFQIVNKYNLKLNLLKIFIYHL